MLTFYIILGCSGLTLSGLSFLFYLYIRRSYREYCHQEDMKDEVKRNLQMIEGAREYFQKNYMQEVNKFIETELDFCLKLLPNKRLEDQVRFSHDIFNMLYETGARLKSNYIDPAYIISPLKNVRNEMVKDHIDYIRKHMPDENG